MLRKFAQLVIYIFGIELIMGRAEYIGVMKLAVLLFLLLNLLFADFESRIRNLAIIAVLLFTRSVPELTGAVFLMAGVTPNRVVTIARCIIVIVTTLVYFDIMYKVHPLLPIVFTVPIIHDHMM